MNIEFEQNYYDIILNQEQILEKKIYQSIEKKELDKIILKAKSLHINFIEQKIAEKENK
ncbi:MAG: hypothetical protein HC854_14525 [Flavobacterium sp.]|nr:hypothetical protein [Flavobacterium sp.]